MANGNYINQPVFVLRTLCILRKIFFSRRERGASLQKSGLRLLCKALRTSREIFF
jgi:hypothetical protein